jgi:hypothetical protein
MDKSIWSTLISMLPLAILIALAGLVYVWRSRRNKSLEKESPTGITPYGVGGWLSLFLLGAVLLSPLRAVGNQFSAFLDAETKNQNLVGLAGWHDYKVASWTLMVCIIAWQWWVAYNLSNRFVSKSVFHVKLILILGPMVSVAVDGISANILLNVNVGANAPPTLIAAFVLNGIWFLYFTYSKRVQNTYYFNDSRPPESGNTVTQPLQSEATISREPAEAAPAVARLEQLEEHASMTASISESKIPKPNIIEAVEKGLPSAQGAPHEKMPSKNNWQKVLAIAALCATVGMGTWWYLSTTLPAKAYYGLTLGMSYDEVRYVLGAPQFVNYLVGDGSFPGRLLVKVDNIPAGKSMLDYDGWDYSSDSESRRVSLIFDKPTGRLTEVSCYSQSGTCDELLKVRTGMDENEVLSRLGKADQQTLEFGVKTLYYAKLNLVLYLEKLRVYMIALRSNPHT